MAFTFEAGSYHWQPKAINEKGQNFALLILNHALEDLDTDEVDNFKSLWQSAKFRISIDGGTNELIGLGPRFIPDFISGDLDSIKKSSLNHFKKIGVEIIETVDQDHTDFTKALLVLNEKHITNQIDYIVALCQVNHRLDQTFANINTLHRWCVMENKRPIFMMDLKGSLSWLMEKGCHQIMTNSHSGWCSVIPFDGSATITSTGLLYNMDKMALSFGSFISTSNQFAKSADKAVLHVDGSPVLWSQHYQPPKSQ